MTTACQTGQVNGIRIGLLCTLRIEHRQLEIVRAKHSAPGDLHRSEQGVCRYCGRRITGKPWRDCARENLRGAIDELRLAAICAVAPLAKPSLGKRCLQDCRASVEHSRTGFVCVISR